MRQPVMVTTRWLWSKFNLGDLSEFNGGHDSVSYFNGIDVPHSIRALRLSGSKIATKMLRICDSAQSEGASSPACRAVAPNLLQDDSKITPTSVRHANGRAQLPRVGVSLTAL
jgi:hypothetical protein